MLTNDKIAPYLIDHGLSELRFSPTPTADPREGTMRGYREVARHGDHVLMLNELMGDMFDHCGTTISYVGRSCDNAQRDIRNWHRWLRGMRI